MSRKTIAADFTISGKKYCTVPKTRSETFMEYVKNLGYIVPASHKPEHYDYIFVDSQMTDCANYLMRRAKQRVDKNFLDRVSFKKENGSLLSGQTLTEALKAANKDEEKRVKVAKNLELARENLSYELQTRIINSKKWTRVEKMLDFCISLKDDSEQSQVEIDDEWQKRRQFYEKECKNIQGQLNQKYKELQALLDELIKLKNGLLCNTKNTFSKMFDKEDKLISLLRSKSESYGTELLERTEDPFALEQHLKEYEINIKNLDRLQYIIVYEFARRAKLNCKDYYTKQLISVLNSLIEEGKRIDSEGPDIKTKMMDEINERSENLRFKASALKKEKLTGLSNWKMEKFHYKIRQVQDFIQLAKRKENTFFEQVGLALISQKIRLDTVSCYLRLKSSSYGLATKDVLLLSRNIKNLCQDQKLISEKDIEIRIQTVPSNCLKLLFAQRIHAQVLLSLENTYRAISIILKNRHIECYKKKEESTREARKNFISLVESEKSHLSYWERLSISITDPNSSLKIAERISKENLRLKGRISSLTKEKDLKAYEAIGWKKDQILKINSFIKELNI